MKIIDIASHHVKELLKNWERGRWGKRLRFVCG
jgi:hypothetical protein